MDISLTAEEVRVLGCLLEKKMATPEYYPLSLNALVNACNQKVNRNPVVSYDERIVLDAIEGLRSKQLLWVNTSGRVEKYAEALVERQEFTQDQAAVICILLLRGPQTVGEIRGRSDRLHSFEDLDAVHQTLRSLSEPGYVQQAGRQPGQKETRYTQLMGTTEEAPPHVETLVEPAPIPTASPDNDRITELEDKVESLTIELNELKQTFESFKAQFA